MKEFVASSKELSCALPAVPFLDEVKEKEKERIEKEGLGVLKVYPTPSSHIFTVSPQSSLTYLCAREMGYTHFDCEEIPSSAPPISRDEQASTLKKKRLAQTFGNITYDGLETAWRDAMLHPATRPRRNAVVTRTTTRPPNW